MTNEEKENINPIFYSSEIKNLAPIVKEKEKVEYVTFRNTRAGSANNNNNTVTSRSNCNINYNNGNNYTQ